MLLLEHPAQDVPTGAIGQGAEPCVGTVVVDLEHDANLQPYGCLLSRVQGRKGVVESRWAVILGRSDPSAFDPTAG